MTWKSCCPKAFAFACAKAHTKSRPSIAFESKADVDANYVKLMKILMKSGIYHGIASHDENIIREAQAFAMRENIAARLV